MRKKQAVIIFSTAYLPLIGGAELAIKEITDRMNDLDFFLITSRMNRAFPRRERIGNVNVYRVGVGIPLFDKLISPFAGVAIARRLAREHAVVCFWSMMVTFTSLAPFLLKILRLHKKIPILLTLQEGDAPEHMRRARFGLVGLSWRFALRCADQVTVISGYLADMARAFGYKGEITVVPNGADINRFKIQNSKFKITNQKSKVIITTSRLVKKNGIDVLIDAIAKVKKYVPDIQCWILGDGPERKKIELRIKNYELGNNIKFFGTVSSEEVLNYLAQADIFVRPSRSEGLGTAFLEAMAAELPIIGTPVGGIPDFLKDGETGLFTRVDDADDLAEKIARLCGDAKLRERLAASGRRLAEEHYDWHIIANRMRTLFEKKRLLRLLIATGIYPPDIGGPATYSKTIAEEFSARGMKIIVVSYGDKINEIESRNSYEIRSRKISKKIPKGLRHFIYFLNVLWHGRHADIIYAQQPVSEGLPAMLAAKILHKKFVLKVVGDYAWEQGVQRFGVTDLLDDFLSKKYESRVELLRKVESIVARSADRVITPSRYLADVVMKWGVPQERIGVIPNAVEIPEELPAKEEARLALGISPDAKLIVSAGRLVPWKGFSTLIDCMPDVARHEQAVKLIIIGSGPEERKLKLQNNVVLLGSVSHDDVLRYLRVADVFVLNTAYEGFSHILIEAMAAGTPVITTPAGGNKEIINDGENALLVSYNNKEELERAIVRALRESILRRTLAENGRKTVAQFTKNRMVGETLEFLLSL